MKIISNLVSKDKYDIKCPYEMKAEFITVHNTENDAPAENEIKYMITNNNKVSFHYAVDDEKVVQGIPEDRNAWHAGDGGSGKGNRTSIAVEICYSKSGGDKFTKAEKNAAEFIAELLYKRKWNTDRVKRHKDWSGKDCPRLTMKLGWDRFLKMVQAELDKLNKPVSTPKATVVKTNVNNTVLSLQKALNKSYNAKLVEDGIRGDKTNAEIRRHLVRNFTSNEYARWIQQRLEDKGYDIKVDGKYGPASAKVVKSFQQKNKLVTDGIVGYNTCCKLI